MIEDLFVAVKGENLNMEKVVNEDLIYLILSIVEEIPIGSVATYGQIASLSGRPKNSRLVGKILSISEYYGKYPCHRVVNHKGRIAPHYKEQKELLTMEGVKFKDSMHVDLKTHQWKM